MSNKTSDKNVAKIEDDVKIVKEFIDYAQGVIDDMEYERPVDVTAYQKDLTSMQNILAEREQKDKRIQELEEQVKTLDEAYTGTIKESKKWFDIAHNSIPKQVVIDEVKRLKNMLKATTEGILQKYTVEEIIIKINTFEELLEDMENGRK